MGIELTSMNWDLEWFSKTGVTMKPGPGVPWGGFIAASCLGLGKVRWWILHPPLDRESICIKRSNSCSLNIKQRNLPSMAGASSCPGPHEPQWEGTQGWPHSPLHLALPKSYPGEVKRETHNIPPKPQQPVWKGKIMIQSDCSFGTSLRLKEKLKQKPFSFGENNRETTLRSEGTIMGTDRVPCHG